MGDKLLGGIRDDFSKYRPVRRETNESLKDIKRNTTKTEFKANEFLDTTSDIMGRAMERILGITPEDETIGALLAPLEAIAGSNEVIAEATLDPQKPITTAG